jgi:tetratricopeptide (TPR) repeat protein
MMDKEQLIQKVIQLNKEGERDKNKYQEVIDLLSDEVLKKEKSDILHAEKSLAYYRLKKYTESKNEAERALQINPNNAKGNSYIGIYFTDQKDYKKAEGYFQKSIEKDPDYATPYNCLGNIYYYQKDYAKAETYYQKAIENDPDYIQPYNGLGNIYYYQKDYTKAEAYYQKVIEKDPNYTQPYNGLGNIYSDQKGYKKAEEYYQKAIEKDPDNIFSYSNLGDIYYEQKEYTKAEAYYQRAIEKDPDYTLPRNGLGNVYKAQKDYPKAKEYYIKAIEKEPDFDAPYFNLGLLYYLDIEPSELEKAKDNFQKYVDLTKNNPDEFTERAKSYLQEIDEILNSVDLRKIITSKDKIKNILKFDDGEISHFTSLTTVNLLVENGSPFRLSEATFLNDSSEGKTLFDFLKYNSESNTNNKHEYTFAKKPFIGSFVHSTKHNDLALWRLYGKEGSEEGRGCSITLDSKVFLQIIKDNASEATKQNFDNEFQFYKVAYWDDNDHFILDNEVNPELATIMLELKSEVDAFRNKTDKAAEEDLNVQEVLNEIAYLFKNKEYQYENEIRLVIKDPFGYEKHFAVDNNKIPTKIYIELCPIQKCISSISIGPKTPNKDDWAAYFHYFFDKFSDKEKMEKVKIYVSTLPYK